jgi:hypothetical protein
MPKSTVHRFAAAIAAAVCALAVIGFAAGGPGHSGRPGTAVTVADSQWGSAPRS